MEGDSDLKQTVDNVLAEGKKYLAAGEAEMAVERFQEACTELSEAHGDMAVELAEPYYLYGKALIEMARSESTLLGTGIPVPAEKEDSSDDEADPGNDATETSEGGQGSSTTPAEPTKVNGNTLAATNEGVFDGNEVNGEAPVSGSADEPNEQEETDLKLAWEILELARVICQKQEGEEFKLKLADVHLALAEVSLESDQIEQAITDQNTCLQLREFILEPHDRRLAEVHFNLGLAYILSVQPNMAVKHFTTSKELLLKRKDVLEKQLPGVDEEKRKSIQEEIKEITELVPDVDSKIVDTQEVKKMLEEREKEKKQESGFPDTAESDAKEISARKKGPATDISHLVRKRVSDGGDSNQTKKQRSEDGTNTNQQPSSTVAEQ